jgi:CheY-like chemotaxis protein
MYEPQPYILLIDDDKDDLEMFSSGLQKKGIKVKTFDSSTKALFHLTLMSENNEFPSLIIMDYSMPKKNGQQVLLLIKSNVVTKDIPVVIYSGGMSGTLKTKLLEAGALDGFEKPWTHQEYNKLVEIFQELTYSFISNKNLA